MIGTRFITCQKCDRNLLRVEADGKTKSVSAKSAFQPDYRRWAFVCRCGATPVLRLDTMHERLASTPDKHIAV